MSELADKHKNCTVCLDVHALIPENERLLIEIARLKDHHVDQECSTCGVRDCPGGDPLHYHHDGCPNEYTLEAEVARLKTERDEAVARAEKAEDEVERSHEAYQIQYDRAEASVLDRNAAITDANLLRAEVARLRDALKPFGLAGSAMPNTADDDMVTWSMGTAGKREASITVSDLRRASSALEVTARRREDE